MKSTPIQPLLYRWSPVLMIGVAVLAWVLIQHSLAARLEDAATPPVSRPALVAPTISNQARMWQWMAYAQRQGYQVMMTMQADGPTLLIWQPSTQQQWVVHFERD